MNRTNLYHLEKGKLVEKLFNLQRDKEQLERLLLRIQKISGRIKVKEE